MTPRYRWSLLVPYVLLVASCTESPTGPENQPVATPPLEVPKPAFGVAVNDGNGLVWRQLNETMGISWNAMAQQCPTDGQSPCWARFGAVDLGGWVWATEAQVLQLLSGFAPGILANHTLSGAAADPGNNAFFARFDPLTTGGCSGSGYIFTCSFGAFASGWTATSYSAGSAVQATVQSGFFAPSLMQVASDPNVAQGGLLRGHFMWRPDVSDGSGAVANDDAGEVESPYAGVAVENVLANDLLGAAQATLANVSLAQLSTSNPAVSLDAATGAVSVAAGQRPGSATLSYRICETARPANCDVATVAVTVTGRIVDAVDDAGTAKTGGGIAVASVLANDKFGELPASLDVVSLTPGTDPYLSITESGAVVVAAGTPVGSHDIGYEICQIGNPINCDQAVARVAVTPYQIDAVQDEGTVPSNPGGTAIANVLANDRFDNGPATLANVTLSLLSSPHPGVTLDLTDGSVDVAGGTPGGRYDLLYQICETANPSNCDDTKAAVTVKPQTYVISKDRHRSAEGSTGSFTVKLSQPPMGNVVVSVSYLAGTIGVAYSPSALTFTPTNWNTAQTVTFSTKRDSDKVDNAGTLQLDSPGIAPALIVINGIDKDRKATLPAPILQAPYNGETVSGLVSLWGTATSTGAAMVEGKFSIDEDRIATVTGSTGTYRASLWNSATVANGWHTVEFRVTDAAANDGRVTIKIFVKN